MKKYLKHKKGVALIILYTVFAIVMWALCLTQNSINSFTQPVVIFISVFVCVSYALGIVVCWIAFAKNIISFFSGLLLAYKHKRIRLVKSKNVREIAGTAFQQIKPLLYGLCLFVAFALVFSFPIKVLYPALVMII